MSITVKLQRDERVINFGKGADTIIKAKLAQISDEESTMINKLDSYAANGYRTIMYAMKEVEHDIVESIIGGAIHKSLNEEELLSAS